MVIKSNRKAKPPARVKLAAKEVMCRTLKGKGMKRGYSFHNTLRKRRIKS